MFSSTACHNLLFGSLLIAVVIIFDNRRFFLTKLPKGYHVQIVPAVLVSGNWSCYSWQEEYRTEMKSSRLTMDSDWWHDCNPPKRCFNLDFWMAKDSDHQLVHYLTYVNRRLVSRDLVLTQGSDYPVKYGEVDFWTGLSKDVRMIPSHCLGEFVFRNVLDGSYLVESTYNQDLMEDWMKMVGRLFQVGYFYPCHFSYFWGDLKDGSGQCVFYLHPMDNVSSYDLWN